ncbi:type III polyketide synthase [Metabacillus sediminilitoris]|uniref:Type III polyketide synthase n=1 Tax=Metabacillus sediminilitoris TaxID=2567941 RepID=A0A4V6RXH6_9BACI|nr:3-oxoacyl-[acyl-carrier-protein] synthase III C-terminal domain-containing protein [Metabacillus sediminilitoris]QGQ46619.1 type III polyketide synthase [Metabacillus sediminilitoris]THF76016.1 type III polyketide synthase [Metabacillus sediminilitoris]
MAHILSVGKAIPQNEMTQDTTVEFAKEIFKDSFKEINRLLTVFKNGEIQKRQFVEQLDWYKKEHSFEEKNEKYIVNAVQLSCEAIKKCLANEKLLNQKIKYEEIDAVIFVSSTGISTPSIDAKIMNQLPFKETTKRIPIWGLGCAGGASGLSRAFEYCKAFPTALVLIICVELCSLTFQHDDRSKSNLIGTSLFADGVACTCIAGEASEWQTKSKLKDIPFILETRSTFMRDSEDVMGWKIKNNGFYVVFSRDIPTIISKWLRPHIILFLQEHRLTLNDITHFVAHPGGKKVIEAYMNGLGFTEKHLHISKKVLTQHGNMSSATVMYVLQEYLEREQGQADEYGLIGALGPGFSSEILLIQWKGV